MSEEPTVGSSELTGFSEELTVFSEEMTVFRRRADCLLPNEQRLLLRVGRLLLGGDCALRVAQCVLLGAELDSSRGCMSVGRSPSADCRGVTRAIQQAVTRARNAVFAAEGGPVAQDTWARARP